ncbi:MAG: hypothetical protein JW838_02895 [Spirochaetes bacterium]|nr:hypothetical protein [Spirochaetota bacterium]
MTGTESGLKFSVRANWVPIYINEKLIAGRVMPLHRMEERLFNKFDDRGMKTLQEFYHSRYGIHADHEDKRLTAVQFLKKNHFVSHAIAISYDKTVILLGYSIFQYHVTEKNPRWGVYVDYLTALPVNYPGNIKLAYLGKYRGDDTFYKVRGVGKATIAMACDYAITMHPGRNKSDIAVELTARSDESLIRDRYVKDYGLEFHPGKRGKGNDLFFTFEKAAKFLKSYESEYRKLERPEGNGLTYKDPFKY